MAGIDVGSLRRWEYLLLGQPLGDVAIGESLANKGELIVSPSAHRYLCPPLQKCLCSREPSYPEGFYKVSDRPLVAAVNLEKQEDLEEYELYFYGGTYVYDICVCI
ncbi:hypothetical protein B484DRAFT_205754 [Ochromonadaceae sp. CCMP2298]|nr:hypothetical protein B484DRAFT_205754 [Ochromonadaceae sp. CCMP2298]